MSVFGAFLVCGFALFLLSVLALGAGLLLAPEPPRGGEAERAPGRSQVERVLEANRRFLATAAPEAELPDRPRRGIAVVACMDARLTELLPRALGLGRGDAAMIRTAGHAVLSGQRGAVLRSLAVACHFQGVKDVLVVGHTGCGMRRRRADVAAAGLDPDWLGSFEGTVEDHVRRCVAAVARCRELPAGVRVAGMVIDTWSGALALVCRDVTAGADAAPVTSRA